MRAKNSETTLLDSSLISKYNNIQLSEKMYDLKIIDCGNYVQVYKYSNYHFSKDKSFIDIKDLDTDNLRKKGSSSFKSILLSNAIRSNLNVQRLARCNCDSWVSFITLTYSENIKDINTTNKQFNYFISNIRKLKKDFKYLAVPEFQKRGAVHYHILSNLDLDQVIIFNQEFKKGSAVNYNTLYDVKYWNHGFARVDFIKNNYKKIYSYLTKYMVKDIDDRLFMKKRYFFSQNLIRPVVNKINLNNKKDYEYYSSLVCNYVVDYQNIYIDSYTKSEIQYTEYKKDTTF